MIRRVDRIQLAAWEAEAVASTWETLFGAERLGTDEVKCLGARRITLLAGTSRVEILQPEGPGAVQDFVDRRREGLFGAGLATTDLHETATSLAAAGVPLHRETTPTGGNQIFFGPTLIGNLRGVISEFEAKPTRSAGVLKRIYEITNLVTDLGAATDFYARALGLDATGWRPIDSELYGYTGKLTLFEPPDWLDRFEVVQTNDETKAMGKFHKRNGDSFYMCFAEADDFSAVQSRLEAAGARHALRDPSDFKGDPNVLFVHPAALGGMLFGVSKTGVAWEWSSRVETAEAASPES